MTFDEFYRGSVELHLGGAEVVALYVALNRQEAELDSDQRAALDRLKAVLYGELTVEDMESIEMLYAGRSAVARR